MSVGPGYAVSAWIVGRTATLQPIEPYLLEPHWAVQTGFISMFYLQSSL